jgi:hypothetical protein|uniref:Uncharacterized protein n=1 Tax=Bionectria ochroleuca TaxID=29856 RepID=A0A8H7K5V4_BIOOC
MASFLIKYSKEAQLLGQNAEGSAGYATRDKTPQPKKSTAGIDVGKSHDTRLGLAPALVKWQNERMRETRGHNPRSQPECATQLHQSESPECNGSQWFEERIGALRQWLGFGHDGRGCHGVWW